MAGINSGTRFGPLARAQYNAVLQMRWRVLLSSLRSRRGRFELVAGLFGTVFFGLIWLVMGISFGYAAYQFTSHESWKGLAPLFWAVLAISQIFPVMVASAQENVDLGLLLRFPVSFASYVVLYLLLGVFDLAAMFGVIALAGIGVGIVAARPSLVGWVLVALALFAAFNLLLTRAIFAWIERWMAQRRSREILGMVFLVLFVGVQVFNPAWHRGARSMDRASLNHTLRLADSIQRLFPPGLVAASIRAAARGGSLQAGSDLAAVALYASTAAVFLGIRLRAGYRGENLGETPRNAGRTKTHRAGSTAKAAKRQRMPISDGPIRAILTKEIIYLSRSSVMLFSLITPLLFLFLIGGSSRSGVAPPLQVIFPIAIAYGFLPLTRIICNSLGGEGGGVQLYFLSPTPFRTVMLAKNILHTGLFCLEMLVAALIVIVRAGWPSPGLLLATLCWALFALPANLAIGNLLSITMAYRMTLTRLSREQGSVGNGLLSFLSQLLCVAIGAAVYLPLAATGRAQFATPIFLILAAIAFTAWLRLMRGIDGFAARRRERLIDTLLRAA
jgi:ABC-2 type transport system permease protein